MAVNHTTDGHVLPCERRLEELWDQLAATGASTPGVPTPGVSAPDRLDEHQRECPHCQAALRGLRALRDATRELADEDLTPPPGLTQRIMSAVRAEVRRGDTIPLPAPTGRIDVSEQAVAVVLRFAADGVPGVRARRCQVRARAVDPDGAGVVDVRMSLALAYGTGPADQVLAEVRARIAAAASAGVGVRLGTCHLHIEDVLR